MIEKNEEKRMVKDKWKEVCVYSPHQILMKGYICSEYSQKWYYQTLKKITSSYLIYSHLIYLLIS